jgi:CheY-like chemotaxis protein
MPAKIRWVATGAKVYHPRSMQLKLRSALVIGKADAFRRTIVQFLKNQGWIVHGIARVEQGLPILQHIPYQLILIDSELLGATNKELMRALNETRRWRTISPVILIDSRSGSFETTLKGLVATPARKSAWKADLSKLLLAFEEMEDERPTGG